MSSAALSVPLPPMVVETHCYEDADNIDMGLFCNGRNRWSFMQPFKDHVHQPSGSHPLFNQECSTLGESLAVDFDPRPEIQFPQVASVSGVTGLKLEHLIIHNPEDNLSYTQRGSVFVYQGQVLVDFHCCWDEERTLLIQDQVHIRFTRVGSQSRALRVELLKTDGTSRTTMDGMIPRLGLTGHLAWFSVDQHRPAFTVCATIVHSDERSPFTTENADYIVKTKYYQPIDPDAPPIAVSARSGSSSLR